jgi:peptide-methionine (S)-S-oxide reductase
METAIFGGGCFWCTEAVFQQVRGVVSVVSGYAGGSKDTPSYEQVSMGTTGHAEVIKIDFQPEVVSFRDLLEVFFAVHDPTTMNRQGADTGTQYRSIILYTSDEQKRITEEFIAQVTKDQIFENPIVTQVEALGQFFPAEDYHQNYYQQNKDKAYCQVVINPKLAKFKAKFASFLKE